MLDLFVEDELFEFQIQTLSPQFVTTRKGHVGRRLVKPPTVEALWEWYEDRKVCPKMWFQDASGEDLKENPSRN